MQEQQQHADVMVWAPASPALAANSSRRADKLRSSLSEVLREYPAVEWVIRMGEYGNWAWHEWMRSVMANRPHVLLCLASSVSLCLASCPHRCVHRLPCPCPEPC